MKPRIVLASSLLAAVVLAWFTFGAYSHREPAAWTAAGPQATPAAPARKLAPATLRPAVPRPAMLPRPGPAAPPSLEMEFLKSRGYQALYERIRAGAEAQTPAGKYVMFEILRACATIVDRKQRFTGKTLEERRNAFYAALPVGDPLSDKRAKAFDAVAVDRCAGLSGLSLAQADLDKLLAEAANGGDPGARASLIEQQLMQGRRSGP